MRNSSFFIIWPMLKLIWYDALLVSHPNHVKKIPSIHLGGEQRALLEQQLDDVLFLIETTVMI